MRHWRSIFWSPATFKPYLKHNNQDQHKCILETHTFSLHHITSQTMIRNHHKFSFTRTRINNVNFPAILSLPIKNLHLKLSHFRHSFLFFYHYVLLFLPLRISYKVTFMLMLNFYFPCFIIHN